ncbi:MAG: DUF1641 domain-containing protein [Roseiflexaceae bacterium]|nr:DUF1641 domain-containing protein [Roseiflexaceae bacterium]
MTSTLDGHHRNGAQRAGVEQLLDRLNEPRTLEALNRLLDHAELLAFSAASLDGLVRRSEVIVENVTSTVAEVREALPAAPEIDTAALTRLLHDLPRLLELTSRLTALTATPEFEALLNLLSNPSTMTSLQRLLQHAELLAYLVEAIDALIRRSDTIVESINVLLRDVAAGTPGASESLLTLIEMLHRHRDYVPRLIAVVPQFTELVEQIGPFVASEEFRTLLTSGVFDPDTVTLVGRAGDAFVATYNEDRQAQRRLGPIGLVRALYDPDVQRIAALLVDFARRFGKSLNGNGKGTANGNATTP